MTAIKSMLGLAFALTTRPTAFAVLGSRMGTWPATRLGRREYSSQLLELSPRIKSRRVDFLITPQTKNAWVRYLGCWYLPVDNAVIQLEFNQEDRENRGSWSASVLSINGSRAHKCMEESLALFGGGSGRLRLDDTIEWFNEDRGMDPDYAEELIEEGEGYTLEELLNSDDPNDFTDRVYLDLPGHTIDAAERIVEIGVFHGPHHLQALVELADAIVDVWTSANKSMLQSNQSWRQYPASAQEQAKLQKQLSPDLVKSLMRGQVSTLLKLSKVGIELNDEAVRNSCWCWGD